MSLTKQAKPIVTPHSLQGRCAHVMYLADHEDKPHSLPFLEIASSERERYERMAAAALSLAYREPVE